MFYSKGMSHLGFALEKNKGDGDDDDNYKGDGDDDDNYSDSTPFSLLPCIQPRCTTPHKAAPL